MQQNSRHQSLLKCLEIIGGQSKTARALGFKSRSNVNNWLKDGLPHKHALPLRNVTLAAAVEKGLPLGDVPSLESLLYDPAPAGDTPTAA